MPKRRIPFNLFDVFLILLVLLAGLSVYFSFFHPIRFSHLIHREDVKHYAEADIVLPDDLSWIKDKVPVGEEWRDVFGRLDWKIISVREETLAERKWTVVRAKILVSEKESGIIRYGKYTLAAGSKIFLINDHYLLEGRLMGYRLTDERVLS